jgi:peptide/nickel transport system permease protein
MILPMLTLLIIGFWSLGFVVRNIVLGVLQEDYIMSARPGAFRKTKSCSAYDAHGGSAADHHGAALPSGVHFGQHHLRGHFFLARLGNLYWIAIQQNDIRSFWRTWP